MAVRRIYAPEKQEVVGGYRVLRNRSDRFTLLVCPAVTSSRRDTAETRTAFHMSLHVSVK